MRVSPAILLASASLLVASCSQYAPRASKAPITGIWDTDARYGNRARALGQLSLEVDPKGVVRGQAHHLTPRGDWQISLSSDPPKPGDPRFSALGDDWLLRIARTLPCRASAGQKTILTYVYAEGEPAGVLCLRSTGYTLKAFGNIFGEEASLSGERPTHPGLAYLEASSFETSNIIGALINSVLGGALAIIFASGLVLGGAGFWLRGKVQRLHLAIDIPTEAVRHANLEQVKFFCLVIRHGNDQFIERMASPLEKRHGRLLNRVVAGEIIKHTGECAEFWRLSVTFKVHRRLGTQFTLFLLADEGDIQRLRWSPFFTDRKVRVAGTRLYFQLTPADLPHCQPTKSIEGFDNIMIYPSDLPTKPRLRTRFHLALSMLWKHCMRMTGRRDQLS